MRTASTGLTLPNSVASNHRITQLSFRSPDDPVGQLRADGNQAGTLEALARRYYAPLRSFFRKRTRNPAEVQDLVQQVFLRLAQRGDIGHVDNPDSYIFRTAANTLNDHFRYTQPRDRFTKDPAAFGVTSDSDFSPERVLVGRESLTQVVEALRALPERTRDILIMRCFEGLKHAEIADLYGVSVRAVEKQMAKALAHLSRALERGTP